MRSLPAIRTVHVMAGGTTHAQLPAEVIVTGMQVMAVMVPHIVVPIMMAISMTMHLMTVVVTRMPRVVVGPVVTIV